jgi:hypothetical protein
MKVYQTSRPVGLQAAGFIGGGALFLLLLLVVFLINLAAKETSTTSAMPGLIGGMSTIGVFMILRGVTLLKNIRRVIVDDAGVRADGFIASTVLRWDQIRAVGREKKSGIYGTTIHYLVLMDQKEKPLVLIPDSIEQFEALAAEIESRSSAARGAPTAAPAASKRIALRKGRRTRKLNIVLGGLLFAVFATIFVLGVNETLHTRRYETEGVQTEAKISRRYMNRVTPRISYSFRDSSGKTFTRETSMDERVWTLLESSDTVPVVYLPDNPDWNRMTVGETEAESFGGKFLLLSGGGTLLFAAMLVISLMGIDIRTEDGKLKVVRLDQEEPPAPQAATAPPTMPAPAPPGKAAIEPPAPVKPTGLIVLGSLAIVVGVIGLLRAGLALTFYFIGEFAVGDRQYIADTSMLRGVWSAADGALALLLIVAGVGLVLLRRWGRPMAVAVALMQLISSIGAIAMIFRMAANAPELSGEASLQQATTTVAAVIGQLIGAIFPLVLLIVCVRRSTAAALEQWAQQERVE